VGCHCRRSRGGRGKDPITSKKPAGTTYPNTYNESGNAIFSVTGNNRGGYLVNMETMLAVESSSMQADAGPARARSALLNVKEYNPYTDYASGAANGFGTSSFNDTGSRALDILSQGTKRLGTGIAFSSTANVDDEAAGESAFVRLISARDTAQNEIFCVDGFGRIGLGVNRSQTSNLSGLPAKLCFAAATTESGGIEFGGDVHLYRQSADQLKLKDGLHINSGAGAISSVAGAAAGIFFSNAGRIDVGRNDVTLEVLRVYGVAGDANPRLRMLGNGQMNWQRADGTNDFNIEPDSTTAMTGLKIGTATTQKMGFFNATPVAQPAAYTNNNAAPSRTLNAAGSETLANTSAVLSSVVNDLKALGLIG
jgi:hypothetical protein